MTFKNILLSLLGDGAVRRKICSIASACTSGEGTTATWGDITGDITNQSDLQAALATAGGDLQSVTDSGNTTSNALQITGMADLNLTLPSTAIFDQGAISGLYRLGASGVIGAVEITDTLVALTASSSSVNIRPETGSDSSVLVSGRIEADPGINANDCAVMSQLTTLGETSTTAYRGDRGKTAYDHSQIVDGTNPHNTTFANIASKPTTLAGYGITDGLAQGGNNFGATVVVGATSNNAVQILANNSVVATFPSTGGFNVSNNNYANATSSNNALLNIGTNGLVLSRNIADANTVLKVNHINASSTGPIAEFQKAGTTLASVNNAGKVTTVEDIEITTIAKGLIIKSPDGTRYRIVVANGGALSTTPA